MAAVEAARADDDRTTGHPELLGVPRIDRHAGDLAILDEDLGDGGVALTKYSTRPGAQDPLARPGRGQAREAALGRPGRGYAFPTVLEALG